MGNSIFKILYEVVFIALCSAFTMLIGNITLYLLHINYFLTYFGAVGVTIVTFYLAGIVKFVLEGK